MRWIFLFAAAFFLSLEAVALTGMTASQEQPPQTRRFTLYVRDGYIPMLDGSQMYVWAFTQDPNGPPRVPGPPIVVNEGDSVEVTLVNDRDPTATAFVLSGEGHTIHLHGLDTTMEHDGVPETFAPGLVRQGGSYTYRFTASHAGTYFYHCHQNNVEHQQMGMYGPLVVRAAGGVKAAYTGGPAFDSEQTLVLAEMGAEGHEQARRAVQESGAPYNWLRYSPTHFLINDRAFSGPSNVATSLDSGGERLLVRAINAGYIAHALHTQGRSFQVVASDGRPWPEGPNTDTVWLGPGEKYDLMFTGGGAIDFRDAVDAAYTGPSIGAEGLPASAGEQASGEARAYTLYVRDGVLTMPDGAEVYVYGFTDDPDGPARVPGPIVMATEGDWVEITLVNDRDPSGTGHGLRLWGDAVPEGPIEVAPGESGIYGFVANSAGSYFYSSMNGFHQQMGMYGAVVVTPADGSKTAHAGGPAFDQAYTMVLSEMDSAGHEATRSGDQSGSQWQRYRPNYFLINGLAYPDTIGDTASMIHAASAERILIRAINAGWAPHAMHLHGYHFKPVARSGRAWPNGPLKDTLLIAPGESYDLLFVADQGGIFPFHDHFETANTNDGIWLGGMHTMVSTGAIPGTPATRLQQTVPEGPRVFVRDNFYTPNSMTVSAGTTVVWEHQGRVEHSVSSLLGFFESGVLRGGDYFTYTFSAPGRYDYFCRFHITNRGVIVVQ